MTISKELELEQDGVLVEDQMRRFLKRADKRVSVPPDLLARMLADIPQVPDFSMAQDDQESAVSSLKDTPPEADSYFQIPVEGSSHPEVSDIRAMMQDVNEDNTLGEDRKKLKDTPREHQEFFEAQKAASQASLPAAPQNTETPQEKAHASELSTPPTAAKKKRWFFIAVVLGGLLGSGAIALWLTRP